MNDYFLDYLFSNEIDFIKRYYTYQIESFSKERFLEIVRGKQCSQLRKIVRLGEKCNYCTRRIDYIFYGSPRNNGYPVAALLSSDFIHFSIDHVFPKSKGGVNHSTNWQVLCKLCNSIKSDNLGPPRARQVLIGK